MLNTLVPKFDGGPRLLLTRDLKVIEEMAQDPHLNTKYADYGGRMILYLYAKVGGEPWYLTIENGKISTNVAIKDALESF